MRWMSRATVGLSHLRERARNNKRSLRSLLDRSSSISRSRARSRSPPPRVYRGAQGHEVLVVTGRERATHPHTHPPTGQPLLLLLQEYGALALARRCRAQVLLVRLGLRVYAVRHHPRSHRRRHTRHPRALGAILVLDRPRQRGLWARLRDLLGQVPVPAAVARSQPGREVLVPVHRVTCARPRSARPRALGPLRNAPSFCSITARSPVLLLPRRYSPSSPSLRTSRVVLSLPLFLARPPYHGICHSPLVTTVVVVVGGHVP